MSINKILDALEEVEDKEYMNSLFSRLKDLNIIKEVGKDEKTEYKPKSVSIAVTKRCNLKCRHCSYSAFNLDEVEELNLDGIKSVLKNVINANPESITITGGEPMVRKDFDSIIHYLGEQYKGKKLLMTNGTLINEKNINNILKNIDKIDISIDGINEDSCSKIRGKGVFEKVIKSVKKLQENNFYNISLSMVFTGNNYHFKKKFFELCKELQVKALPRFFIARGRGKENFDELNKKNINIDNSNPIEKEVFEVRNIESMEIKCCSCSAGINELFIEPNGDMFPCPLLTDKEYYIANILEDNICINQYFEDNMLKNYKAYKSLLNIEPDGYSKCKNCNVNIFCWTCPADLNEYMKSEDLFSNWCKYHKKNISQIIWEE